MSPPPDKDPFAAARIPEVQEERVPFDKIVTETEQSEIRDHIREEHLKHTIIGQYAHAGHTAVVTLWNHTLANALCYEPNFQRVSVEHWIEHGSSSMPSIKVYKEWIIGQYLQGFYHYHKTFDLGYKDSLQAQL